MSQNRDGGLAFKATLDIDDFNASAEAMERRIRKSSTNIGYESERAESSILDFARNGAKYIVTYLIANGLSKVASSIVQVRGQFQQLEIAFETMLGSASKSQRLMNQMIDTAAKTPFDLTGVAMGAKQLLAYGFEAEKVNDTLIRLGNIASGLSVPLGDMVYLYGTTMTQGRLYAQDMRQFMGRGIPLAKELASMYGVTTDEINKMVTAGKIGFSDVEKVITKMTDSGGQFFNLMNKQSESLTGMIANLGDAWDVALNKLGKDNEDVFAKGIQGATYLVENLDGVLRIIKAIAIAYGAYRAAIVANTLATKGNTGIALIDNTVKQAKIGLVNAGIIATKQDTTATIAHTKAVLDNLRAEVKTSYARMISNKEVATLAIKRAESARYELYWAKQSNDASKIAVAQRKYEGSVENQSIARKAALTASTEFHTKKAQLESTAIQASTASKVANVGATTLLTRVTNGLTVSMRALWASMKTNPLGWILTGVGLLISAFSLLNQKHKEAKDEVVGLTKASEKASEEFDKQASKIDRLNKVINNSNISYNERNKALSELKGIIPGYNAMLTDEGVLIHNNTLAIDEYLKALEKQIKLKAVQEELEEAYRQKRLDERSAQQKIEKGKTSSYSSGSSTIGGQTVTYIHEEYTTEEANKIMQDATSKTAGIIEELNEEIKTTSIWIEDNTKTARTYTQQIADTQKEISILNREINDMRSGKVVNDNLADAIDEKVKQLGEAEKRLANLTGVSLSSKGSDSLNNDIIDRQMKLEQAKIDVMEDGSKKRLAILELEHKQNMLSIEREEAELKKSGSKTPTDKGDFESRRNLENDRYLKAQNKLFNEEINYKKEQYELYWRWVENMGSDVANKRFSELLNEGQSYKDYLENQLQQLNLKSKSGSLTDADNNILHTVKTQLSELTGEKSALESFKTELDNSIQSATTLAEKIGLVSEAMKKLEDGKTGIVGADNIANANLFVQGKQDDNQKQIREKLLNDFKTYEERKTEIINEHNVLRVQKQVQYNRELLDKINKGEADALSALNAEMLKQSDDWQNLFVNLDYLTASEIERIVTNIEAKLADTNLKLNPVDYNALVESLNEAKAKLISANPFKVLGNSFNDYIRKLKELKQAQQDNLSPEEMQKFKVASQIALQEVIASIESINDMVQSVGDGLGGVADSFGEDQLSQDITNITDLMGATAQAGTGVAKIISGDIVGGVKDLATGLANAVQIFNRMHDQKKEKQIIQLQKEVDKLSESYKKLADQIERAYGVDKGEMIEEQNKLLEEQNKAIRRQIQAEQSKKKTDKQKIKDWQNEIAENEKEIAENRKYNIVEAIMGTDIQSAIDQFADAYADAWAKGEDAAEKSSNVIKNLIRTAIIESLKGDLSGEVTKMMQLISDSIKNDGVIDAYEQKQIDEYERKLELIAKNALKGKEKWLTDDELESGTDKEADPLTGAINKMSEETGSIIAGRLNAIIINQGDSSNSLKQSLIYQKEIAENTRYNRYLESIDARLGRIESKESSLINSGLTE